MSIRIITTAVIDCDGPDCDEVFMDTSDATVLQITAMASRSSWTIGDQCFCPKCRAKLVEQLKKEIASAPLVLRDVKGHAP